MSALCLPSSPNWYLTRACDSNSEGLFAFASRNKVIVLNFKENLQQIHAKKNEEEDSTVVDNPSFYAFIEAHTERVTSTVFSIINPKRLATAGDDGLVRVWELLENGKFENVLEHTGHSGDKVLCVDWSPLIEDLIFSGDESGTIIIWSYNNRGQPLKTLSPEKSQVCALSSSPHNERFLAIGYQSSLVLLMDLRRGGHILHKLRGHDDEIQGLQWSPFTDETFLRQSEEQAQIALEDPEDYFSEPAKPESGLILTSSRDRTIRLWSLTSGKQLQLMRLPTNTGYKREASEDRNRVFVTVDWMKDRPHQFLSSTHGGELLLWDLRRPATTTSKAGKQASQRWRVVDQHGEVRAHHRIIFNLASYQNYVISTGLDRKICVWDTEQLKCVETVHTCGGFVYCIAGSQLMPGKLAFGVGDQMIRLWNTCNPANQYDITYLWQGIKSKVTALSWHPVKEGLLAYGTEDGRVGIYDTLAPKPPSMSSTFHKRTVYVLRWAPSVGKPESEEFMLYSVGDGAILCHDRRNLDRDAVNLSDTLKNVNQVKHPKVRSEISWKPDYSVFAIGSEDGSVELYRHRSAQHLATLAVNQKIVNVIAWHPHHTTTDVNQSQYSNYLAIGSNNNDVIVCDVTEVVDDVTGEVVRTVSERTKTLSFHKSRVTALSWSPHQEGLLVSVSYDGVAQIWDAARGKALVNYTRHRARLLTVLWSPLDQDHVYTGGEDFTVQRWSVSDQAQNDHPGPLPQYSDRPNASRNKTKKKRKVRAGAISVVPLDKAETPPAALPLPALPSDIQKLLDEKRAELNDDRSSSTSSVKSVETKMAVRNGGCESKIAAAAAKESKMAAEADDKKEEVDPAEKAAEIQKRQREILESIGAKLHIPVEIPRNRSLDMIKSDNSSRKRRSAAMFPFSNSMESRNRAAQLEDCQALFDASYGRDIALHQERLMTDVNFVHLGVYGDLKAFQTMLRAEEHYLLDHSRVEQYLQIQVFRGDLSKAVDGAAQAGYLSDWLLAIAAGSKQTSYLSACASMASQLERDEQYVKAATYHLACHQVHKAVDLLIHNKYFREAVVLARLRLFRKDPKLNSVYTAWADHFIELGNLEHAAKCSLALHDPLGAARLVGSRSDRASLRLACHMVSKLDESGFSETGLLKPDPFTDNGGVAIFTSVIKNNKKEFSTRYIRQCQIDCDWKSAMDFAASQLDMKDVELELSVHQTLLEGLRDVQVLQQDPSWQPWLPGDVAAPANHVPAFFLSSAPAHLLLPWRPYSTGNQSYSHAVLRRWLKYQRLDLSETDYLYQRVQGERSRVKDTTLWKQALISVSRDLTLALMSYLCDQNCRATCHVLDAMYSCYHGDHQLLLKGLCRLLMPHGPDYLHQFVGQVQGLRLALSESIEATSTPEKITSSIMRAISAFYYYSVICDLRTDLLLISDSEKSGKDAPGDTASFESEKTEKLSGSSVEKGLPNGLERGDNANVEEDVSKVVESKRTLKDIEEFLSADMVRALVDEFEQMDLAKRFQYERILKLLSSKVQKLIKSHKAIPQAENLNDESENSKTDSGPKETVSDEKVSLVGKYITIELDDPSTIGKVELNQKSMESPTVEISDDKNVSVSFSKSSSYRTQTSVSCNLDKECETLHDPDYVIMKSAELEATPTRPEYSEVGVEWYGRRAEDRYSDDRVSLAVLGQERQYYQDLLQGLPEDVQSLPYPDVIQCAEDLLELFQLAEKKLALKHDLTPAIESLQRWLRTIAAL